MTSEDAQFEFEWDAVNGGTLRVGRRTFELTAEDDFDDDDITVIERMMRVLNENSSRVLDAEDR